jgi:hypothetical protein
MIETYSYIKNPKPTLKLGIMNILKSYIRILN